MSQSTDVSLEAPSASSGRPAYKIQDLQLVRHSNLSSYGTEADSDRQGGESTQSFQIEFGFFRNQADIPILN